MCSNSPQRNDPQKEAANEAPPQGVRVEADIAYINRARSTQPEAGKLFAPHHIATPGAGAHLLLVDDNEFIRNLLTEGLSRDGFAVCSADTAEAGLELLRNSPEWFDVAVLDDCLPGLSGGEAITEMRRICPHLKAILMSGYYSDDYAIPRIDQSFSRFVHKPFELTYLTRLIHQLTRPSTGGPNSTDPRP